MRCGRSDLWYKNAIVYSLDLETFMDGNGDGCGDFHGLMHDDGAHRIAIEEFGYRWFRVGGLGYALKRLPGRPHAQNPR